MSVVNFSTPLDGQGGSLTLIGAQSLNAANPHDQWIFTAPNQTPIFFKLKIPTDHTTQLRDSSGVIELVDSTFASPFLFSTVTGSVSPGSYTLDIGWDGSTATSYEIRLSTVAFSMSTRIGAAGLGAMTESRDLVGFIGSASPLDVNMYSFSVIAGQRVIFDIDRPSGSALNSHFRLFDSNGTQLAFSDNQSAPSESSPTADSWLAYTFSTAGTYYIGVSSSGNSTYDPVDYFRPGESGSTTGSYNLEIIGGRRIASTTKDEIQVSLTRVDKQDADIDPSLPTWVFVHGLHGSFQETFDSPASAGQPTLSKEIRDRSPEAQILALDWDASGSLPFAAVESRIPSVAAWAADHLRDFGFLGSKLNLIGHSFGSNIAGEIAALMPDGVNTIIALDPAADAPLNDYHPQQRINFAQHSQFSWAFHDAQVGNLPFPLGHFTTPTTAHEAFNVLGGSHTTIDNLLATMLHDSVGGGGANQYFQLARLLAHTPGPWVGNQYNHFGARSPDGGYEAVISTSAFGTVAQSIRFGRHLIGDEKSNTLTGTSEDDIIEGRAGNDVLNGLAGKDELKGEAGNDTYFVDNASDLVKEFGVGTDTVVASRSYTLLPSAPVEVLRTISPSATNTINLTGSASNNTITGNNGANTLRGLAGNDNLQGLSGNDTLDGGAGDDVLNGGLGSPFASIPFVDALTGGAGRDTFVFSTRPSATNVDRITDFRPVDDTIQLDNSVFTRLIVGRLPADAFHVSTSSSLAADLEDRIVYQKTTGALFYDSNGNAPGGVIKVAQLTPGLSLTNADFFVI